MSFLKWITKRKKTLSEMNRSELRRQELLLEKDRNELLKRITKLARDKHDLFERGRQEKVPDLRRMLAQEFELHTSEQLMLQRQLNLRSKELMTVSRFRMMRENADRAGRNGRVGLIGERDMLRLSRWIEADSIRAEVYQQRLDEVLLHGREADQSALVPGGAGEDVLEMWERLDAGELENAEEAFEEADRRVRQRQADPSA